MIRTERLLLRRWREADFAPLAALNADPEVMRWIRDGSVCDDEETRQLLARVERSWEERGFGLFAVEVAATGELAGFTGLSVPEFLPEVLPAVEVGWRLGRQHWGKGYATEAARAALRFGFEARELSEIVSIAQVGNAASERVMAKLGMRVERETVVPEIARPVRVWALGRTEYLAG